MRIASEQVHNLYDFEVEKDILFFKVNRQGLVSFHGVNYNLKKPMTREQLAKLTQEGTFAAVASNCYVNLQKVISMNEDSVCLGRDATEYKNLPLSKRQLQGLKSRIVATHRISS
ncbi:hypothetical protein PaecuDRAFT_1323 [Paenibacillus curdlanolyticus YK9]|uniref:Response regulator receiver protein n=1 Tax=Paenibacillus curdlanolyticus YK9 TaxID=717606 RepID=E0I6Q1_9BACL|nr:hypothetical protein [Paenibacillus curdlanolyticus]EFM11717.1 hypothetical protein PaecuDRAFT_1323 [Paenibacillus curdlanolyticus YK9]